MTGSKEAFTNPSQAHEVELSSRRMDESLQCRDSLSQDT